MFFSRRREQGIRVKHNLQQSGVGFTFLAHHGSKAQVISIPMEREALDTYCRWSGFSSYVAWEELYEQQFVKEGILSFDHIYRLLQDEDATEILKELGIPDESLTVTGILRLESMPLQAELNISLYDSNGRNLDRVGLRRGAMYDISDQLYLLPERVYRLLQALEAEYEHGYQKIGICQKLAEEAGIQLERFLENEDYRVIDSYEPDILVHAPDHLEVIIRGNDKEESEVLQGNKAYTSFGEGTLRRRYVKTKRVTDDLTALRKKSHIRGEEVPVFLQNPSAVLEDHTFSFDLEEFSERVKGIVPIQRIRPQYNQGTGLQWVDETNGEPVEITEEEKKELREVLAKEPTSTFVQTTKPHPRWVFVTKHLKDELFGKSSEQLVQHHKSQYRLDIHNNEDELEFKINEQRDGQDAQVPIPPTLNGDLFDHQVHGYRWLIKLSSERQGGLLADDMGLGKTLQVIAYLLYQHEQGLLGPTMIVTPIALIENWIQEIEKFAPTMRKEVYVHRGSQRLRDDQLLSSFGIIITSYDTLKLDQMILGKIKFRNIVCDEAQNAKSHASQRSHALRAMQANFRLAMTGTPVENSLEELWSIMDYVQPGYLGSLREFRKRYIETSDYDSLVDTLKPHYLRRTKEEVLKDRLPRKVVHEPITVEASVEQKQLATTMVASIANNKLEILNVLGRLRQLYGHPGAVYPPYEELESSRVPKLAHLFTILDSARERGEKVLVFTEFRRIQYLLKRAIMQRYGVRVPIISGETSNRQAVVLEFNQSIDFGVMILSQKAAGVGLTITSANHVIHYTRWWNPAVENQATDRAYRIGQTKDVYVHHMITTDAQNFPNGTVEQLMHQLLILKSDLAQNVLVPFQSKEIEEVLAEMVASSRG
ncbi:DEAD/DEAH box helicase [Paenibacillus chungangensis]|uniref:DEAD/DEAH box helicase n=1 Tax=Paenibacillus chungangensis TaxID=696535 RepID=A0ABW3HSY7_9BACL